MREQESLFDGMSDGDTTSVETPFGEVVFQFDAGDRSVGINPGVFVLELTVNGVSFDRDALEKVQTTKATVEYGGGAGRVTTDLARELENWAGTA